jgi:Protein of unknown function (DUF4241)
MTEHVKSILELMKSEAFEIGTLPVPTGRLMVCDPFFSGDAPSVADEISPGNYRVTLHRCEVEGFGRRVCLARLTIDPHASIASVAAAIDSTGSPSHYLVDSGLAAFMDASFANPFSDVVFEHTRARQGANYYSDLLESEFRANADNHDNPFDAGDWCMHQFTADANSRLALFSSGLGDGAYEVLWALDARGNKASLITHFDVFRRAGVSKN